MTKMKIFCWGVLCLLPSLAAAGGCEGAEGFAQVGISVDAGQPTVTPDSTTVYLTPGEGQPGAVCWVVSGLAEGQVLHIEGDDSGLLPSSYFKVLRSGSLPSGKPTGTGEWHYDVRVTQGDRQLAIVDPVIIIDPGSSGGQDLQPGDGS